MESILTSIKKLIGPTAEYEHFDPDIIMHINTVFSDLHQMGVGPSEGFAIEDDTSVWTDYIEDPLKMQSVKSYMYLRVKLLFDNSTLGSGLIASMERQIEKLEWRLNMDAELAKGEEET